MYSGRRPAWRYRLRRSGWTRIAAQLVAPVVLGLLIGGVLAYQAGSTNDMIHPVPLGAVPSPTPSFGPSTAATGAVNPPSGHVITPPAPGSAAKQTATANAPGR